MPSYTFVTTASSFVRVGAVPVFVDIRPDTLNIDESLIEAAITERTRAICVVHYAGVACEMDRIIEIARKHNLLVIEDAALGVNAFYKGRALGSIGDLGCYSFHETKNYICGEGGALCINNPRFVEQAEIIRDKGTNRQRFLRGNVDKYTWVALGSSYVPSELCSAFLYGQLEELDFISARRNALYERYYTAFADLEQTGQIRRPVVPADCEHNSHIFYLLLDDPSLRVDLLEHMKQQNVHAVFHYLPLHSAPFIVESSQPPHLPVTDTISNSLFRLPLYFELSADEQHRVITSVITFNTFPDSCSSSSRPSS